MFRRCKDTTISPNIQGYPRFLSVCVRFSESFPTQRLLCCMEICPPEKQTNVSHFISWGLFCNYQKDVAARRAATSMFWFKENQTESVPVADKRSLLQNASFWVFAVPYFYCPFSSSFLPPIFRYTFYGVSLHDLSNPSHASLQSS